MTYVGIDLHKKTIALCVVNKDRKKYLIGNDFFV